MFDGSKALSDVPAWCCSVSIDVVSPHQTVEGLTPGTKTVCMHEQCWTKEHLHVHVPLCIKAIAWPKVAHVVHQVENKVDFHFLEKFGLALLCCPHKTVAGVLVLVANSTQCGTPNIQRRLAFM